MSATAALAAPPLLEALPHNNVLLATSSIAELDSEDEQLAAYPTQRVLLGANDAYCPTKKPTGPVPPSQCSPRGPSHGIASTRHNPEDDYTDESEDDIYDLDIDDLGRIAPGHRPNAGGGRGPRHFGRTMLPGDKSNKFSSDGLGRVNNDPHPHSYDVGGTVIRSSAVSAAIRLGDQKASAPRNRGLTKESRATVDLVLDPRTRQLLDKLKKWDVFESLYGCISAGKEANVYLGEDSAGTYRAVKVFKTSILIFKDRARYVEGEFRFRRGYAGSSNPRKMVRQWAEKEFRNLKRLASQGIRCPIPVELRGHVMVMTFLGNSKGEAAPKLKDVTKIRPELPVSFWRRMYIETIVLLRMLYRDCKLAHGDFSEYNILFNLGHPYVIDVSQSVEHDHPQSLEFLKRDCFNVTKFFSKMVSQDTDNVVPEVTPDPDSLTDEEVGETDLPLASLEFSEFSKYCPDPSPLCDGLLETKWNCLSVEGLFDFIRDDSINATILTSGKGRSEDWVTYDDGEVEASVLLEGQHSRIRGPGVTGEFGLRCVHAKLKPVDIDEIKKRREVFKELCVGALVFVYDTYCDTVGEAGVNVGETESANPIDNTEVFMQSWTPHNLSSVADIRTLEREMERFRKGQPLEFSSLAAQIIESQKLSGVPLSNEVTTSGLSDDEDADHSGSVSNAGEGHTDDESGSSDGSEEDEEEGKVKFTGKIPEGVDPKEWKKIVKAENREKRKVKTPKHIKKKRKGANRR